MEKKDQNRFDMVKRAGVFLTTNAADYTTIRPPDLVLAPGQLQIQAIAAAINTPDTGLIAMIGKNATTQQSGSGEYHGGVTTKTTLRDGLMLEIKGLNRSAATIAAATKNPGLMDSFRMPYGEPNEILVAKANAMADAAEPQAAEFIKLYHAATFVDDFRQRVTEFDEAEDDESAAEQKQAGATQGFAPLLADALLKVKQADAFMHNFYKNDAVKLGEWATASHIERAPRKKKDPNAPAAKQKKKPSVDEKGEPPAKAA
jgi:hypothetical protein